MKNKERMCFGILSAPVLILIQIGQRCSQTAVENTCRRSYDYVILPEDATPTGSSSIETREDGLKCAELFRQNRDRIDAL